MSFFFFYINKFTEYKKTNSGYLISNPHKSRLLPYLLQFPYDRTLPYNHSASSSFFASLSTKSIITAPTSLCIHFVSIAFPYLP